MKSIIIAILFLVALAAARKLSPEEIQFRDFQVKYNKVYGSHEFSQKFVTFKDNLNRIDTLNANAAASGSDTKFGVNEFADLSVQEFRKFYMNAVPASVPSDAQVAGDYSDETLASIPSSFDWRTKGAVTPVKNQGQCGSCWSFSTTGNVEGQWFLAGNTLTGLSEQNLVDCDHHCMTYDGQQSCDDGCNGGLQPNAFQYIIGNGGIDTETSYPYLAVAQDKCQFKASNIGAKISNWQMLSTNETQIAAYLALNGPVSIAADAAEWQFYIGGVFDLPCGKALDHGILIVGYDTETNIFGHAKPYWWVKNSWGASWGEQGYLKVLRGAGECGLNTFVSTSCVGDCPAAF
ncbi:cysteine protease [Cavenderia fasciculata]|uniref:Cysteine protease n=1 Tax=Cavenderia fasciculata TaxID=261658 RepID=F4Q9B0_CACFS|nr:cysteine protease [Cavenderia fasciculata]EGG15279.1 cysteine protease [Cavenderia fasciculata]|eukprot:XP_004351999.1 cysteine protease [Cavenderia fasciculata]